MRASRFSMLTLGLALVLGLSAASMSFADDAAQATGTISGKVVDADGKPVKGAHVMAFAAADAAKGDHKDKAGKMPPPLSKADTAEDGTFKLDAVPAGAVRVAARLEKEMGRVKGDVTVTAGQDTKVDDIKLVARKHDKKAADAPQ